MSTNSTPNQPERKELAGSPEQPGVRTPEEQPVKPKRHRTRMTWNVAGFKIKKPYPEFPLVPHASGAWKKKIRGRAHYFGRWGRWVNGVLERVPKDGWEEALEQYKAVADDLHAGRPRRVNWDALTLAELCNRFLTAKLHQRDAGEIGARMFAEYQEVTDLLVGTFGKTRAVHSLDTEDFATLRAKMAERWGPVRLGNAITRIKSVFKFGMDNTLLDRPPRYGSEFSKPKKAVLRRHRAEVGERMLEAEEICKLIKAADVPFRAMLLLGINCGFGNFDVASLPMSALDLECGWIDFPRPKTGIGRRCPLWPETVQAIREALAVRPNPRDPEADASVVFLMPTGRRWVRVTPKSRTDNVSFHFTLLMKQTKLHRDGVGFYVLRHTFRTVADSAKDPVAIDLIMGHTDPSMAGHYRERIDDARLVAVTDHVRAWLFGKPTDGKPADEAEGEQEQASEADNVRIQEDRPRLRLFAG